MLGVKSLSVGAFIFQTIAESVLENVFKKDSPAESLKLSLITIDSFKAISLRILSSPYFSIKASAIWVRVNPGAITKDLILSFPNAKGQEQWVRHKIPEAFCGNGGQYGVFIRKGDPQKLAISFGSVR